MPAHILILSGAAECFFCGPEMVQGARGEARGRVSRSSVVLSLQHHSTAGCAQVSSGGRSPTSLCETIWPVEKVSSNLAVDMLLTRV